MTESRQIFLVLIVLLGLELFEYFVVHHEKDTEVFAPKIGWRLFYFGALAASTLALLADGRASHGPKIEPSWFALLVFGLLLFARPATIVATSDGLVRYSLYGLRHVVMPWAQVARITSDWQEEKRSWFTRGYRVSAIARTGTRVEHTFYQRKQGRFLDALRGHLSASAFDAGLYDWHP